MENVGKLVVDNEVDELWVRRLTTSQVKAIWTMCSYFVAEELDCFSEEEKQRYEDAYTLVDRVYQMVVLQQRPRELIPIK